MDRRLIGTAAVGAAVIIIVGLFTLSLISPSSNNEAPRLTPVAMLGTDYPGMGTPTAMPTAMPTSVKFASTSTAGGSGAESVTPTARKLVIKNGSLSIVAQDVRAKASKITSMAEELGGWVVNSRLSTVNDDLNRVVATINIRVPAERFDEALQAIKNGAVSVLNETVTGQDVSAQYADAASQVKNYEAAELQLQKILETATKTEDILNIFRELTRIRGEIERLKGQMQYFVQASDMSLITVTIHPVIPTPTPYPTRTPEGFSLEPVANSAAGALSSTLQLLISVAVWIVIYALPLGLLFGVPALIGYRATKRARSRKQ